jgi:hypothetical protein
MPNRMIELHDSRVTDIRIAGDDVVLEVDAYVHESEGVPGVDPGTGSSQEVRLVFERASIEERSCGSSLWILDGSIICGTKSLENQIPIPFDLAEPLELIASGGEGRLRIRAARARLVLVGEPRFVEHFP